MTDLLSCDAATARMLVHQLQEDVEDLQTLCPEPRTLRPESLRAAASMAAAEHPWRPTAQDGVCGLCQMASLRVQFEQKPFLFFESVFGFRFGLHRCRLNCR